MEKTSIEQKLGFIVKAQLMTYRLFFWSALCAMTCFSIAAEAASVASVSKKKSSVTVQLAEDEVGCCKVGSNVMFSAEDNDWVGKVTKISGKKATIKVTKGPLEELAKGTQIEFTKVAKATADDQSQGDEQADGGTDPDLSTSRGVRGAKKIGIAPTIGLINSGFTGFGVRGNYALSEKIEASAIFLVANNSSLINEVTADYTLTGKVGLNLFDTQVRYYTENSFFLALGVGTIGFDIAAQYIFRPQTVVLDLEAQARSIFIDFGIGNQWSFASGLYIDVSWFTFSSPFSSSASSTITVTGDKARVDALKQDIDQASEDFNKALVEDLGKGSFLSLFYLGLGYRF